MQKQLPESQAIAHLQRQLEQTRAQLAQQQLRSEAAEARSLALHDLANALQAIFSAADTLESLLDDEGHRLSAGTRDALQAELECISDTLQHIHQIHHSLRPSQCSSRPAASISAAALLVEVSRLLSNRVAPSVLVRTVTDRSARLFVNQTDITRVLINLVRNAVQAIKQAGISDGRITLRVVPCGERTQITVQDNGPGIPAALQGQLFDAGATSRAESGGTGLGLYIARGLVEANSGSIRFECPPEGGTTFHLLLPATPPLD